MALRWKAYAPNTVLKAVEVQDLADNGVVQVDTAADLADANLVNANATYVTGEHKAYQRIAAGVGADKWGLMGGKVLQVVRATITSDQTTNNTTAVPVPGWTLTITPKKTGSKIVFSLSARVYTQRATAGDRRGALSVIGTGTLPADAKEFIVGGIQETATNIYWHAVQFMDYHDVVSTNPTTFTVLYHTFSADTSLTIQAASHDAQLYAYEIEEVKVSP